MARYDNTEIEIAENFISLAKQMGEIYIKMSELIDDYNSSLIVDIVNYGSPDDYLNEELQVAYDNSFPLSFDELMIYNWANTLEEIYNKYYDWFIYGQEKKTMDINYD